MHRGDYFIIVVRNRREKGSLKWFLLNSVYLLLYSILQIKFEGLTMYGSIYFLNLFLYPESGKCKSTGNKHCLNFVDGCLLMVVCSRLFVDDGFLMVIC